MSTTVQITNACEIAETFGKRIGLTEFEIDRVVRAQSGNSREWVIHLKSKEADESIEDDACGAIIVVDDATGNARLIDGL